MVVDGSGRSYVLDSNIDPAEGDFLAGLITRYNCRKTIEVGCAYGISSLYIASALEKNNGHEGRGDRHHRQP